MVSLFIDWPFHWFIDKNANLNAQPGAELTSAKHLILTFFPTAYFLCGYHIYIESLDPKFEVSSFKTDGLSKFVRELNDHDFIVETQRFIKGN
jgi:hypothetical protein